MTEREPADAHKRVEELLKEYRESGGVVTQDEVDKIYLQAARETGNMTLESNILLAQKGKLVIYDGAL